MKTVNIRQARRDLSKIVDAAERGETVVITRRGRRAARVTAVDSAKPGRLPDLADFRASLKVKGKPLSQGVVAARKEARF